MDSKQEVIAENSGVKTFGYNLSRIDRSVADNLRDIDNSFEADAQLVFDFIIFMSKKLQNNLFGYTQFTIKEFSEFTGMNVADLCAIHPDIASGRVKVPVYEGHRFESVLDYSLLRMLKTNIVFSKIYSYRDDGNVIKLENFPILKDVYLLSGSVNGTKKVYEVRLSDVIIDGFVARYYTLDTSRLPIIGKGKGGHARKKIFVWLNKLFHIYSSKNTSVPLFSVDSLADLAGVRYRQDSDKEGNLIEKLPKHKKEAVNNILKVVADNVNRNKLHFSFEYTFVKGNTEDKYTEDYFVKFTFTSNMNIETQHKLSIEHKFKLTLLRELRQVFDFLYPEERLAQIKQLETEKDSFQRWLNNKSVDVDTKVEVVKKVYYKSHDYSKSKQLKDSEALAIIYNGFTFSL